jgi:predicted esterase
MSRVCLHCGRVFDTATAREQHQASTKHAQEIPSTVFFRSKGLLTYEPKQIMEAKESIKVLALHGSSQTAKMFENILQDMIRIATQKQVHFSFLEAKYDHPLGGKSWYSKPLNVTDIGQVRFQHDLVNSTMQDLAQEIADKNITCLLGFSQGANVADTYIRHFVEEKQQQLKCAVLCSGYELVEEDGPISNIPVLNVISKEDEIVPWQLEPKHYKYAQTMVHNKGHKMPTSKLQVRQLIDFIVQAHIKN